MDKQELNRKLAKWAGFVVVEKLLKLEEGVFATWYWEKGGKKYLPEDLDFTQSLDACFKWLVPKLTKHFGEERWGILFRLDCDLVKVQEFGSDIITTWEGRNEDPALALCLAIEKLIDQLS